MLVQGQGFACPDHAHAGGELLAGVGRRHYSERTVRPVHQHLGVGFQPLKALPRVSVGAIQDAQCAAVLRCISQWRSATQGTLLGASSCFSLAFWE